MVKTRFSLSPCLLFMLVVSAIPPLLAETHDRQVVKIGLIFPLTGPMSSFGEDMAKAVPFLEKKFNSEQSVYRFELLLEDGKFGHSNAAITAARKLVNLNEVRFLAVGSSGEILQIAPFVESARVLAVAGFASHPDVKKAGDFVFRTYIDAGRGINLVVEDMLRKGFGRVAVISEESSFTMAVKDALRSLLGDRLILSEDFSFGDSDFRTLIAKARSKKPQAYYLNTATPANFITLFRQLRENGVSEQFYVYYTPSLKDVQNSLGSALNGTIYLDYPDTAGSSAEFNAFLAEFEKQTGVTVRAPFNFRTNYNAVKVIYDGIVNVGADPVKVKDYLYSYDHPSATGRLRFDSNGDVVDLDLVLRTFESK